MTATKQALERAYEAGRTAGILEMASREQLISSLIGGNDGLTYDHAAAANKSHVDKEVPKAGIKRQAVARGVVNKTPRTKGVKEAVMNLISSRGMTLGEIVKETGFKSASVNSTLAGLQKKGDAYRDDNKLWTTAASLSHGNGEEGVTAY